MSQTLYQKQHPNGCQGYGPIYGSGAWMDPHFALPKEEIRGQTGEFPIFAVQNREFTRLTPNKSFNL